MQTTQHRRRDQQTTGRRARRRRGTVPKGKNECAKCNRTYDDGRVDTMFCNRKRQGLIESSFTIITCWPGFLSRLYHFELLSVQVAHRKHISLAILRIRAAFCARSCDSSHSSPTRKRLSARLWHTGGQDISSCTVWQELGSYNLKLRFQVSVKVETTIGAQILKAGAKFQHVHGPLRPIAAGAQLHVIALSDLIFNVFVQSGSGHPGRSPVCQIVSGRGRKKTPPTTILATGTESSLS